MPELPEVETTRRGIEPHIIHQQISRFTVRCGKLRWPVDHDLSASLPTQTLQRVERRGKYLLLHVDQGVLIWHLGMSGSLRIVPAKEPVKTHDHIDLVFQSGTVLRFNDPRRFGCVLFTDEPPDQHPLLRHLGPEPLNESFDGNYLFTRSRKRSQAVKTWIMDAKVVVGVGNIYANEALFNARIHPLKAAGKLSKSQCHLLSDEIKKVLSYAITRGGTTLRDFVGGDGKPGYFAQELAVYGRGGEPCQGCGKQLLEKRLAQRTTVYCSRCQK